MSPRSSTFGPAGTNFVQKDSPFDRGWLSCWPSESRPLSRSLPRLLLFPHRRATPGAVVAVNFFVEQHQQKTLSHWHGAFAGRAEELARLQIFKILLFVRRHHQNREPSTSSWLSHYHFAEVLVQQQRRKPRTTSPRPSTMSSQWFYQFRGRPQEASERVYSQTEGR